MPEEREITCDDCYFRQYQLCALPKGPCPTFRRAVSRVRAPEPPPRPRPVEPRRYEPVAA